MNFDKKFKVRIVYCLQVFIFENFKNRGFVCLSYSNIEYLLDFLEDVQVIFVLMLILCYIGLFCDEVVVWVIKLKEISEVLEQV